jgi:hypothetical protein
MEYVEGENFNYAQRRSSYELPSSDIHKNQNFQSAHAHFLYQIL